MSILGDLFGDITRLIPSTDYTVTHAVGIIVAVAIIWKAAAFLWRKRFILGVLTLIFVEPSLALLSKAGQSMIAIIEDSIGAILQFGL